MLFVDSDLPYSTSERSLLENFSNFGQIAEGRRQVHHHRSLKENIICLLIASICVLIYVLVDLDSVAVKLIKDKMTRRSKGFAFIQFTSQDDAMLAIENMDHQVLLLPQHCFYPLK